MSKAGKVYRWVAFTIIGLLACSCLTFGWLNHQEKKLLAKRADTTEVTGYVEADEVLVSFKVPGRIERFSVDEGNQVKQGQVIARLETDELQVKASQAQAALEAAEAQLAKARNAVELQQGVTLGRVQEAEAAVEQAQANLEAWSATWQRVTELYDSGAVSAQERDKAEAEYKAARGRRVQAQAALDQARSGTVQVKLSENDVSTAQAQVALARAKYDEAIVYLNNAILKAPLDGIVTLRSLEPGETVGAGTPVAKITDFTHTWVKVFVPENKIGRVQLGQKVQVFTPSSPEQHLEGTVTWINPAGDFATQKAVNDQHDTDIRSFEVKVAIPNPDLWLKTGMTVTVRF